MSGRSTTATCKGWPCSCTVPCARWHAENEKRFTAERTERATRLWAPAAKRPKAVLVGWTLADACPYSAYAFAPGTFASGKGYPKPVCTGAGHNYSTWMGYVHGGFAGLVRACTPKGRRYLGER